MMVFIRFFSGGAYIFIADREGQENTACISGVLFGNNDFVFLSLFKLVMDKVEEAGTYYRILWILPMTVMIAYAGVKLIGKHTRIGIIVMILLLALGGEYLYKNINITKAQN